MTFNYFSHNGTILPISVATIPISCIEYTYGFGVYETLRVKKNKLIFPNDHIARLEISANILQLEHDFSSPDILRFLIELVEVVDAGTYNIKILLIGGHSSADAQLFIVCSNPLFPDRNLYKHGVHTITTSFERAYPHAKSLNMLQSYMAYKKACQQQAYDSLLINRNGFITEGTRTNFFAVRGNKIFSAPESDILLGVTRKNILDVALCNGYELVSSFVSPSMLCEFDGAFLSSTSTKIIPIKSVDSFVFPSLAESTFNLMGLFDNFLASH